MSNCLSVAEKIIVYVPEVVKDYSPVNNVLCLIPVKEENERKAPGDKNRFHVDKVLRFKTCRLKLGEFYFFQKIFFNY